MTEEMAARLGRYRTRQGLSQEALAECIGVSRQAISRWERAKAVPDIDNLIALAGVYGVSIDTLLYAEPGEAAKTANREIKGILIKQYGKKNRLLEWDSLEPDEYGYINIRYYETTQSRLWMRKKWEEKKGEEKEHG